jgi:radical SAM/Cys-rich protein
MSPKTADRVLELLAGAPYIRTLDLTGGSPELHSAFRQLVDGARKLRPDNLEIIDRCNLTVFEQPGQEKTPEYLAAKQLTVIASLPCYGPVNVDLQRGKGVFESSVRGLLRLNALGFGAAEGGSSDSSPPLRLHLVYNPVGPTLPGGQVALEAAYRKELAQTFGLKFDKLFCITNMPIKRFADQLLQEGSYTSYLQLLAGAFNTSTISGLMCRSGISVDWDGRLSDCDFNQQLDLPLMGTRAPKSVWDIQVRPSLFFCIIRLRGSLQSLQELDNRRVLTDRHCFACTAGEGSSCGGAISLEK